MSKNPNRSKAEVSTPKAVIDDTPATKEVVKEVKKEATPAGTPTQAPQFVAIQEYVKEIGQAHTAADIVPLQHKFYNALFSALRSPVVNMSSKEVVTALLRMFLDHPKELNATVTHQCIEQTKLPANEKEAYSLVIVFLTTYINEDTRPASIDAVNWSALESAGGEEVVTTLQSIF